LLLPGKVKYWSVTVLLVFYSSSESVRCCNVTNYLVVVLFGVFTTVTMETVGLSSMLAVLYQTTWCHIWEDSSPHIWILYTSITPIEISTGIYLRLSASDLVTLYLFHYDPVLFTSDRYLEIMILVNMYTSS
jgi:hypothetical protein